MIASNDIHKTGLGRSNPWFGRKAQLSQPTLYDGHRLLQPSHAPVTVSDSHETLLETEVSRMKMSQKPGHVTPVDYTKLNSLNDQFVPQKELSTEQVYWLSASDIASQSSDPLKPVTPFVHTRLVNSEAFFDRVSKIGLSDERSSVENLVQLRVQFIPGNRAEEENHTKYWCFLSLGLGEYSFGGTCEKSATILLISVPEGMSRSVPEGVSRSVPEGMSRSVREGMSRSVPKRVSRSVPEGMSRSVPS
nr:hypothetical protein [Tanacetum cinerariifolium]